ncbi:RNA polymerase sigma factor SigJ [Jongsikchunia kroppenstedtii]|uniref:RNA polymerase sigma factor SigJ n=1 Tax=Jongsikchunia kroppenstedtii TaxID=1121721 RepID=UPI0003774863|nr:RNA polymerase sigma factor SigJ [Jongsikchunia kroppenstedtii]
MTDDMTDDGIWFAEQFEQHRQRLRAVAYRMLGSLTDADDALQEAWIRTTRSNAGTIENIDGWLVTLVGRVCIDMLRARRARPDHLTGTWLPEPVVGDDADIGPEQSALLADSVGLAMLVVMESLEPDERLAFVLHDMFGVPFDQIAPIVDRTTVATRQLASRARRRVRGSAPMPDADLTTQRQVVDAFLAAARAADFEGLLEVLDPDVVFRVDAGTRAGLVPALLTGASDVAEHAANVGPRFATLCEPALVNGAIGVVAKTDTTVMAVVGMTVTAGRITEINLVLDADKLAHVSID